MFPSYLELHRNGGLRKRIQEAQSLLESCCLCPRKCGVNRIKDKKGFCRTGSRARVYSYGPHSGEEPPISGQRGSGTIFFSGCNMSCVYCQNYKFSQLNPEDKEMESEELAQLMLELQKSGCHNINLVTPTHILPQILEALSLAISGGLRLPLVYNTSGYELPEVISLLDRIVDIFLPDMRYADNEMSERYSKTLYYPESNRAAIIRMYQQVGNAQINQQGLIEKGLIIRHLVLPDNIAGTEKIMNFIAQEVSISTHISLMSQYLPCYKAGEFPEINRRISEQEYTQAEEDMLKSGLYNGWGQETKGSEEFSGEKLFPICSGKG